MNTNQPNEITNPYKEISRELTNEGTKHITKATRKLNN